MVAAESGVDAGKIHIDMNNVKLCLVQQHIADKKVVKDLGVALEIERVHVVIR